MAMKWVEQRPLHRLPQAAWNQPGQLGRGRCCSRSPVWEGGRQQRGVGYDTRYDKWHEDKDSPNTVEGTGAGRQGRPRERAAVTRARGTRAMQVPASWEGVRRDETWALTVALCCRGHTFLTRRAQGAGQGVAGKRSLPEVLEGGVAPQEEGHGQHRGTPTAASAASGRGHVLLMLGLTPASSEGEWGRVGSSDKGAPGGQCWEEGGQAQPVLGAPASPLALPQSWKAQ